MGILSAFRGPMAVHIDKISPGIDRRPFAECTPLEFGQIDGDTVRFSISFPVWKEEKTPQQGQVVMLSDLRKTQQGWRAMNARFPKENELQPA